MEVILLEDVKSLGKKGQIVKIMMVMQETMFCLRSWDL